MRSATVSCLCTQLCLQRADMVRDQVDITCGTTNALLTIAEPEKCEYFFKATSPALCWPLEAQENASVKEEL